MTDNEIIKALELCSSDFSDCENCPFRNVPHEDNKTCPEMLMGYSVDLINRQKAEIERLKEKSNTPFAKITFDRDKLQEIVDECVKNIEIDIKLEKYEAIKEFAERLKENYCFTDRWGKIITKSTVDNLVKEMMEANENE